MLGSQDMDLTTAEHCFERQLQEELASRGKESS